MSQLTTRQKIAIAIAVPASVGLLYLLFRKKDEEKERPRSSEKIAVREQMTLQMKIPQDRVGAVIGRDGANINKIRQECGARLNFHDDSNLKKGEQRILTITGRPEMVVKAEQLIQEILRAPPLQTADMLIPNKAVGRVIGKGGNNIRSICRASGAKVRVPREGDYSDAFRVCFIKGTPEEIAAAKTLIQDAIKEEEDFAKRLEEAAANRTHRTQRSSKTDQKQDQALAETEEIEVHKISLPADVTQPQQVRCPSHGDYFTVYVSAVEHPNHFWIQIVTDKAKELDLLVETMTEYYSQQRYQDVHRTETLCTGDLLAAPFSFDDNWYRGRVEGFLEDGNVDIYFVDYGDNATVPKNKAFTLRADFLSLPFQAVECSLDGIEPVADQWSDQAVEFFEEISCSAQWKPLMARITGYDRNQSGNTLPSVELIDTSSNEDVNIGTLLVNKGFAKDKRLSSSHVETTPDSVSPSATKLTPVDEVVNPTTHS